MTRSTGDASTLPLEAVVREYDSLKGLMLVPTGAGLLVGAAVAAMATGSDSGLGPLLGGLAGLLVQGIGLRRAQRWYDDHIGSATSSHRTSATTVLAAAAGCLAILAAIGLDAFSARPVLLAPVLIALVTLALLRYALRRSGLTIGHYAACAALALSALLPAVVDLSTAGRVLTSFAAAGLAVIAIGLIDHRRLMSAITRRRAAR
ncbi:MAG: hypothetical protein LWW86_02870 [Micrococcales bacterium]|nr:hypothetical protein [Micrococcales bacterium]